MVVQDDDVEGVGRSSAQPLLCPGELPVPDAARLVPPGADRIQPDHVERRRGIGRLRRLPLVLEGAERTCETCREGIRNVVIARNRQYRPAQSAKESSSIGELALAPAMAEISARDYQFGLEPVDQGRRAPADGCIVTRSEMEIGQV
jgi:hypothetical protein